MPAIKRELSTKAPRFIPVLPRPSIRNLSFCDLPLSFRRVSTMHDAFEGDFGASMRPLLDFGENGEEARFDVGRWTG